MEHVDRRAETGADGAGRLLKQRAQEMFRVYPKALVGDVDAVHDLRVAARRLRSALALLARKPDGHRARRADKALRDLARAAGRGRDLDVGLTLLEQMPHAVDEGASRLRRALRASRSRARVLSREALLDLEVARLRRDLRALAASTQVGPAELASRLEALRTREEETMATELALAADGGSADALHGARRAARRLRYAAELAAVMCGTDPTAADRWRKTQTKLGEIQDRRVLSDWLAARLGRAAARHDAVLAAAASRALVRVRQDAARLTRKFLSAPTWRSAVPTPPPERPA